MPDQLQLRGGTNAEGQSFTGAQREVTVDTDNFELLVHDGVNPGGNRQASQLWVSESTMFFNDNTSGGSVADAYLLSAKDSSRTPAEYVDGMELGFVTVNPNTGAATADFAGLGAKDIKRFGGADPSAGDVDGRVVVVYDAANDWLELQLFQGFDPDTAKTNIDQEFTKRQRSDVLTVAYSVSITIDQSGPSISQIELAGNPTINAFSNPEDGAQWEIRFIQDATGSREPSFGAAFKNTPTSWTATAEAIDIIYGETVYDTDTTSYTHYVTGFLPNVSEL